VVPHLYTMIPATIVYTALAYLLFEYVLEE
jgi:hypothetical protein